MSRVNLPDIRLGISPITDEVFVGILNKKGDKWLKKVSVTNDFLACVINRWDNQVEVIQSGKDKWEITVRRLQNKPIKKAKP